MILQVSAESPPRLLQPCDLTRLSCEISLPASHAEKAQSVLDGIAMLVQGHAWISVTWLRTNGERDVGTEWLERFEKMIDKARPHGWISEDGLSVKAHIVWE